MATSIEPRKRTQQQAGMVAPPPPKPPTAAPVQPQPTARPMAQTVVQPVQAPQVARPPVDDMEIKREAMGLIRQPQRQTQAQPQPMAPPNMQAAVPPPRVQTPQLPVRDSTPQQQPQQHLENARMQAQPIQPPVRDSTPEPVTDDEIQREAMRLIGQPPVPEGEPPVPVDPNDLVQPPENEVDLSAFDEQARALEERLARSREEGVRNIAEIAARRGVLGGSPELGMLSDLEAELQLQNREGQADIMRDRLAFQQQQREFELRKLGMSQDEAFRYAALEQDARFRELALDLQRQGMALDDAYRNAALEWSKEQFAKQLGFDRERFEAANELEKQRLRAQILEAIGNLDIDPGNLPQWIMDIINESA